MDRRSDHSGPQDKATNDPTGGASNPEPRDYLSCLELDFDIEAQLVAVRDKLERNRELDAKLAIEIEKLKEHAQKLQEWRAELAVDALVERFHQSAYQGAAHSMSAVGMLAPLVETIFYQCFKEIGRKFYGSHQLSQSHDRWKAAMDIQWDCHWHITSKSHRRDIVKGVLQLWEATGLAEKMRNNLEKTLSALFTYRNKMFHNGLEWPVEERHAFAKRIVESHWPTDWFSIATHDNTPWIFYMSEQFIEHCLTTICDALDAIGLFVRDKVRQGEHCHDISTSL